MKPYESCSEPPLTISTQAEVAIHQWYGNEYLDKYQLMVGSATSSVDPLGSLEIGGTIDNILFTPFDGTKMFMFQGAITILFTLIIRTNFNGNYNDDIKI